MQLTPALLAAIFFNFNLRFQEGYSTPTPWHEQIATIVPSTNREERYAFMKLIPRLREWIGERKMNNLVGRAYTLLNKDWELTQVVDRNDIDDNNLAVYGPMIGMMGRQAALWPDDVMVSIIQGATTALAFDGQPFFNNSHPIDGDNTGIGTYSNNFTATALNSANWNTVRATMMAYKGEDNKPLKVLPNLMVVPPLLEQTARQILNAEFTAPAVAVGQNAAAVQQTNTLKGSANLLVIPELAGADTTWYAMDTTKPIKPFVFQLRKAPQFTALDAPTSENVFFRKEFVYGFDCRGNGGVTLPFLAARAIA